MDKTFEDKFSEIQTDMIDICLEYANYDADMVYIYASSESNMVTCNYFYKINGKLFKKYELSDIDTAKYDSSIQRQKMCIKILMEDIANLREVCKEYNQDMPTEIKLIYDVRKNSVAANYQYEPQYSNDPVKHPNDIVEEWFQTEKMKA